MAQLGARRGPGLARARPRARALAAAALGVVERLGEEQRGLCRGLFPAVEIAFVPPPSARTSWRSLVATVPASSSPRPPPRLLLDEPGALLVRDAREVDARCSAVAALCSCGLSCAGRQRRRRVRPMPWRGLRRPPLLASCCSRCRSWAAVASPASASFSSRDAARRPPTCSASAGPCCVGLALRAPAPAPSSAPRSCAGSARLRLRRRLRRRLAEPRGAGSGSAQRLFRRARARRAPCWPRPPPLFARSFSFLHPETSSPARRARKPARARAARGRRGRRGRAQHVARVLAREPAALWAASNLTKARRSSSATNEACGRGRPPPTRAGSARPRSETRARSPSQSSSARSAGIAPNASAQSKARASALCRHGGLERVEIVASSVDVWHALKLHRCCLPLRWSDCWIEPVVAQLPAVRRRERRRRRIARGKTFRAHMPAVRGCRSLKPDTRVENRAHHHMMFVCWHEDRRARPTCSVVFGALAPPDRRFGGALRVAGERSQCGEAAGG